MYRYIVIWICNIIMYCDCLFFGRGGGSFKTCLSEIKIFFQNVELDELITNHPICNYPTCTVTELFGLVTSKCIVICLGGANHKFLLFKIKISFVSNVELDELITNHPTCYYLSCTVIELFGLVTSKCIVIFLGGSLKIFVV